MIGGAHDVRCYMVVSARMRRLRISPSVVPVLVGRYLHWKCIPNVCESACGVSA